MTTSSTGGVDEDAMLPVSEEEKEKGSTRPGVSI
jgi:hypothetical protein